MIRRRPLILSAIIATALITACSDMTAPKNLVSASLPRATILAPTTVAREEASRTCPAPGTGLPGALNMLHDPTMFTIPGARAADQGIAGMFHAVAVSAC